MRYTLETLPKVEPRRLNNARDPLRQFYAEVVIGTRTFISSMSRYGIVDFEAYLQSNDYEKHRMEILSSVNYEIEYAEELLSDAKRHLNMLGIMNFYHRESVKEGYKECLDDLEQFLQEYEKAWINSPVAMKAIRQMFIDKKRNK